VRRGYLRLASSGTDLRANFRSVPRPRFLSGNLIPRLPVPVAPEKFLDQTGIELPPEAQYTGYHLDELEFWLAPSEPDGAYLRVSDDVERWPRADLPIGCV